MSNHSRLLRLAATAGAILCILALPISANAYVWGTRSDHLLGGGTVNDVIANCTVDYDSGVYTYNYQLQYVAGSGTVNLFNVENPYDKPYSDASNTGGFWNPVFYDPDDAYCVQWDHGTFTSGTTRSFSYKSIYAPRDITVYAFVQAGDIADGDTWGMGGDVVPEPSSLAGLALAGLAVIPTLRRRRK